MNEYPPLVRYSIRLIFTFLVIAAFIITKSLLVPLFWSILFAYLLYPLADRMESHNIPRILTNLILIVGSIIVIGGVIYGLSLLVISVTQDFSTLQENFDRNITHLRWALGRTFGVTAEELDTITNKAMAAVQFFGGLFTATANTILAIGLIPVYTFLLLFYRNKFRHFIAMMAGSHRKGKMDDIINKASKVVPKYLKGLFIVCFILIWLNALGFYLIGLKYALLLGFIAAFFNLIPYLGTVIGYGIVFLFVLATQSPGLALGVVGQFFVVQFIENNILTPNITGSYVEINPLVIILSLIAGGMIWGLPGLFMIIPYLAILKIFCENISSLKPIGFLLSSRGTERYTISIKAVKRKFGWNGE
jgi:predicted PurR-regulated permease PerM